MAFEKCKRCGKEGTPWQWKDEYRGHICYDCHIDLILQENRRKGVERELKLVYNADKQ